MSLIHWKSTLNPFLIELQMCKSWSDIVCQFSTRNVFSWKGACTLTVLQWSFNVQCNKGGALFLFCSFMLQNSHSSTATCFKRSRLCNIFGSDDNPSICTQFMAQASIFNDGGKSCLLNGSGTHFATWFYMINQLLRLEQVLEATIHGATLNLSPRIHELSWQSKISTMKFSGKIYFAYWRQHFQLWKLWGTARMFQPWIRYTFMWK